MTYIADTCLSSIGMTFGCRIAIAFRLMEDAELSEYIQGILAGILLNE